MWDTVIAYTYSIGTHTVGLRVLRHLYASLFLYTTHISVYGGLHIQYNII